MLGGSIIAGYCLPASAALPAQLQAALIRLGRPALTSSIRLCSLALSSNQLLRGLEPSQTRANLAHIVEKLQHGRIRVIIAGLTGAELYSDLLAGVAGIAALNQNGGIHPNPSRMQVVLARFAPAVASSLARRA